MPGFIYLKKKNFPSSSVDKHQPGPVACRRDFAQNRKISSLWDLNSRRNPTAPSRQFAANFSTCPCSGEGQGVCVSLAAAQAHSPTPVAWLSGVLGSARCAEQMCRGGRKDQVEDERQGKEAAAKLKSQQVGTYPSSPGGRSPAPPFLVR